MCRRTKVMVAQSLKKKELWIDHKPVRQTIKHKKKKQTRTVSWKCSQLDACKCMMSSSVITAGKEMLDTLTILTFFFSCRPQASDTYLLEFPIILCYSLYCSYTGHQSLYSIKYTFFICMRLTFCKAYQLGGDSGGRPGALVKVCVMVSDNSISRLDILVDISVFKAFIMVFSKGWCLINEFDRCSLIPQPLSSGVSVLTWPA